MPSGRLSRNIHIRQIEHILSTNMNSIDRFLRVIYTEANIAKLLNLKSGVPGRIGLGNEEDCAVLDEFWIGGPDKQTSFAMTVVGRYLRCYPKNYSKEEVELLLDQQIADATGCSSNRIANSLELIAHAAKSFLALKDGQLTIRPGYLMEWNGIANRIDQNVLFAAYDAYCGDGSNEGHVAVDYGDRRLKSILAKGSPRIMRISKGVGTRRKSTGIACCTWGEYRRGKLSKALTSLVGVQWLHPDVDASATVFALMKIPILRKLLTAYVDLWKGLGIAKEGDAGADGLTCQDVDGLIAQLLLDKDEIGLDLIARNEKFQLASSISAEEFARPLLDSPEAYSSKEQSFLRSMFDLVKQKPLAEFSSLVVYGFNVYIAAITQFKTWLLHDNLLMGFSRFSASEKEKELLIGYIAGGQRMLYRSVFDRCYRSGGEGAWSSASR